MKTIQNIFARFMALWAMIWFIITFLVFFIPSMLCWLIPEPAGQHIFIGIARLWMRIWLPLSGCRFKVTGKENFRKGETYIVTCNHNSLLDIPLSSPFIPGANKTIAKSSFTKVPLFGFYYMKGSVIVNRNSEKSRRDSFEKMKNVLRKKMHMCIYPEGTRNRGPEPLKKFHDGAFRLAVETRTAIIPTVILNTKKVLPLDKGIYFLPGKISMHFLPEVPATGLTAVELKERVFAVMEKFYIEHS